MSTAPASAEKAADAHAAASAEAGAAPGMNVDGRMAARSCIVGSVPRRGAASDG
jgi:hypothetical protein